ncbi:hypothetical protein BP5796_01368 [Coleophoma crateriformis]|uniref:Myb-like domain-containing protein n=1 Tax=Coleophoma crateriformis TaxID=565419 RepID=A0A3D8T0A6_9HELO|nr:hypothetical protein BP5796_01368 [Coleophoma crateriformis]
MNPGEFLADSSFGTTAPHFGRPSKDFNGNEYNDSFGYYAEARINLERQNRITTPPSNQQSQSRINWSNILNAMACKASANPSVEEERESSCNHPTESHNDHKIVDMDNQQYQAGYVEHRDSRPVKQGINGFYHGTNFSNNPFSDHPMPSIEVSEADEYISDSQVEALDGYENYSSQQHPVFPSLDSQQYYRQRHRTGLGLEPRSMNQPSDLGREGGRGILREKIDSIHKDYYQDPVSGRVYPRDPRRGLRSTWNFENAYVSPISRVEVDHHNVRPAGESSTFHQPPDDGGKVYPSRYSGGDESWGINGQPGIGIEVPPEGKIPMSKASLKKRGVKKASISKDGFKRGYGANDPENLRIMDLFENEQDGKLLKWPEIAAIINTERIKAGKTPGLTANAAQNRYNRTAPVIYASEGRAFVPLRKRMRAGKTSRKQDNVQYAWTSDLDELLVTVVKDYEAQKWTEVARRYNVEAPRRFPDPTRATIDAELAAIRYKML